MIHRRPALLTGSDLVIGIMPLSGLLTGVAGAAMGAPAATWLWVGCAAAALIPWLRRSR